MPDRAISPLSPRFNMALAEQHKCAHRPPRLINPDPFQKLIAFTKLPVIKADVQLRYAIIGVIPERVVKEFIVRGVRCFSNDGVNCRCGCQSNQNAISLNSAPVLS